MKILFLGDIVGREARKTVLSELPKLKNKYEADIIIINIENAADGLLSNFQHEFGVKLVDEFTGRGSSISVDARNDRNSQDFYLALHHSLLDIEDS